MSLLDDRRQAAAAPLVAASAHDAEADAPSLPTPDDRRVSVRGMTVNLITGGLGAGILTLPWGMAGASVVVALLLILLVVSLNACTILILVHAAEEHGKFDLGSLLRLVPGRWAGPLAQGACNALVWLTLWMTLVGARSALPAAAPRSRARLPLLHRGRPGAGYLIIIQDCLVPLAPAGSLLSRRWVWAVIASCVVLPLSLTDLKFLSWTSAFSVCVNLYLFAELCAELYQHGATPLPHPPPSGAHRRHPPERGSPRGPPTPPPSPLAGISPDRPCLLARLDPPPRGVSAFLSLISLSIIIQM